MTHYPHSPNRCLTVEDLYRLPDDDRHYELSGGFLVSEPPPGGRHGRTAAKIVTALEIYARQSRNGVVYTCDTGYILARNPDTVRAPDVSFVTRARYLTIEDDSRLISGPPDLAVEVLSPGDRPGKVNGKIDDYLRFGVPLVWICDPNAQTAQVFSSGVTIQHGINDVLSAPDLLPTFNLPLREIFAPAF